MALATDKKLGEHKKSVGVTRRRGEEEELL